MEGRSSLTLLPELRQGEAGGNRSCSLQVIRRSGRNEQESVKTFDRTVGIRGISSRGGLSGSQTG